MDKVPFSVYDFFAYLSSGSVLLAAFDYISGSGLVLQDKFPPLSIVLLVVLAYVGGHIVAHFSGALLEQGLVGRVLKRPSALLLGEPPRRGFSWLFRSYHRPLPSETIQRVKEKLETSGLKTPEAIFVHVYAIVTANTERQQRLDAFRNQYGFHRNMCFAFAVSAVAIIAAHFIGHHPVRLHWAILSAVVSVTLFYRYLTFFRQFSYELLLRYAEWPSQAEAR